jgi:hypothetical protein
VLCHQRQQLRSDDTLEAVYDLLIKTSFQNDFFFHRALLLPLCAAVTTLAALGVSCPLHLALAGGSSC